MDASTIESLLSGFYGLSWQGGVMIAVGILLIYLAIAKEYEPLLLLPIGAGCMLANLPISMLVGTADEPGMLQLGFTRPEAASIGIIGAIDGPTSIYVSAQLAPHLLGPITVAAYSYMSLVPIIMPPIMRLLTTKKERSIRMPYSSREISQRTRIIFPILVTIIVGILVPFALPLIGTLMLGNLMRESKVVERLTGAAQNELNNIVTLFLGLAIGSTMVGENFIKPQTLFILVLGLGAFVLDTAAGVLFGKLMNLFSGGKFNPLIGAAGISAFPMAARVVQKEASREDNGNFVLMHAMGANAAGQVASAMAGGVLLALMAGA